MKKWSIFKDNKRESFSLLFLSFISNIPRGVFAGGTFGIILTLCDPFFNGGDIDFIKLRNYIIYYVVGFFLYMILQVFSLTNCFVQSNKISVKTRLQLGDKLRRLALGFFKTRDPGDVIGRILQDTKQAEMILSHQLPDVIASIIVPLIIGIYLATINLTLTLFTLGVILLAGLFLKVAYNTIKKYGNKHKEAVSKTSSRVLEYARTLKLLKSYNMVGENFKTLDNSMRELKTISFKQEVYTAIPVQVFVFILDAGYILTLLIGAYFSWRGLLTPIEVITYSIGGFYFFTPIKVLGIMLVELRYARVSTKRIGEVFDTRELDFSTKDEVKNYDIEFKNVNFSYNEKEVLRNINCSIPMGKITALVGASGSGKSTMVNLISRFWDVNSGSISIGGRVVSQTDPDTLLQSISMVFQDVFLFNDTIYNNIKIGKPEATDQEVYEAAKKANCHNFILEQPNGYDTVVSEGGSSLSGGEKQRISIARAILKDAPIVMLDEATASLDPENEEVIQKAFEELTRGKTIIIIAHRFHAIKNAHQILVLDSGTISQRGTHNSLIQEEGVYKKLWNEQQKARGWKLVS